MPDSSSWWSRNWYWVAGAVAGTGVVVAAVSFGRRRGYGDAQRLRFDPVTGQGHCPYCRGEVACYIDPPSLCSSADVYAQTKRRLAKQKQETLNVALLDARNRIVALKRVSLGTSGATLSDPTEVFLPAMRKRARAIILIHNHPSGDPRPSPEDDNTTNRMKAAGQLLGITLLDHLVIGAQGRYFSYRDSGRM